MYWYQATYTNQIGERMDVFMPDLKPASIEIHFQYWGKAKPKSCEGPPFHLLPFHCLDVAAVGIEYVRQAPHLRRYLMQSLNLSSETVFEAWLAFWLMLHDLGKYSESFQSQRQDIFEELRKRRPVSRPDTLRHDSTGMLYWKDRLSKLVKSEQWFGPYTAEHTDGLDNWARAVTGHHGQPPQVAYASVLQYFNEIDDPAAIESFLAEVRTLSIGEGLTLAQGLQMSLENVNPDTDDFDDQSKIISWWAAGVTVLADWLGSNTDFFPYCSDYMPLAEYWPLALERAREALGKTEVISPRSQPQLNFNDIFPEIAQPSPLQGWAKEVELGDGPQIHLLEDVTGAGKTEAAVMLAHRIIAKGAADGFFIGLPTTATANAMYGRIAQIYFRLYQGDSSLVLAHGQRNLVERFAESVVQSGDVENDAFQTDESATARCAAWLADHNKRALLATMGVGTIDQALLAVLQSKHQSLRLLGLFRKVLIVDEVHACDAYMLKVLEQLLVFHARAGGSAILLSATLPKKMKQVLLDAFSEGRSQTAPPPEKKEYPLVTSWSDSLPEQLVENAIPTRPDVCRTLAVNYVSDLEQVIDAIEAALAEGKCVCWMRNTVSDAIAAYEIFRERMPQEKITLFHARFTLYDRLRTERKVLAFFGKRSKSSWRRGRLVIATQVAEQSLDADWDFIVSDLAPIDRLIQRAGRLLRHLRDRLGNRLRESGRRDERGEPCLWVFGPTWSDMPKSDWFSVSFPKAARVYAHHEQLWLTAKLLQSGKLIIPGDSPDDNVRSLIEGVFGNDVEIPQDLQAIADRAQGDDYGEASMGMHNVIKPGEAYQYGGCAWWGEAKTPSRMGEASMDVVLARWRGDVLVPWASKKGDRHAWEYSTLRIAARLISQSSTDGQISAVRRQEVERVKATLPGKGKWSVLLMLDETPQGWIGKAIAGEAKNGSGMVKTWHYDDRIGLVESKIC